MSNQEVETLESIDQTEQIINSTGFSYNIVFNISNLTKSVIKSPIYACDNNKYQILINLEAKPISISIICNDSLNNFANTFFDLFISNKDPAKSIHFNENSPAPFDVHLDFDDINISNGWIQKDSLRTVFVIKDNANEINHSNQRSNYKAIKSQISSFLTKTKETVEWSIPELSEWHSSELYDIKFAKVILILSLDENYYTFQMSFQEIKKDKCFIIAKLILHNKDPSKSIIKNIYETVTPAFPESKLFTISDLKQEEITAENGWIINDCLKLTVEFINPLRKIPNLPNCKLCNNQNNEKYINFHRLPSIDYIQSNPFRGKFDLSLTPSIDDISDKIYKTKIRVGKFFVTFELDIAKKMSSFEFQDLDEQSNFFTIITIRFGNVKQFNQYETFLTQNVSKDSSVISFDSPFDSKTVNDGWLFKPDNNIDKDYLYIYLCFEIISDYEYIPPYEPITIKESFDKKYYINLEIPQTQFKSPLIILPAFEFDDNKKANFFIELPKSKRMDFNIYLDGLPESIFQGEIVIYDFQDPSSSPSCKFESYKRFLVGSSISINSNNFLMKDSKYINKENHCCLLQITFSTVQDSQFYMPSEPHFEKYSTYETDSNDKSDKDISSRTTIPKNTSVGLINQGATCYMNSMLQALFHLPAFRRIVYNMPTTGNDNPEKSIPLNLQRLFCEMQFSKSQKPCSTESLTKSFGWGSQETWVQHDVEEFCRVLMDNLQMKMKGDPSLENSIRELFEVKARHAIRCVNVKYESIREEPLLDIQINVKNCHNLEESFKQYLEKEVMEGDNQYSTEQFGKQDAVMCDEFLEFPPVLHLHLKRFIFDFNTMKMTKLNDYYEFPEQIDLTQFLADDAPGRSKSNLYDLYGVLVHAGGILGGHYDAYLRTSTSKQWYNFNDSTVTAVSSYKAVRANYGYSKSEKKASVSSFDFLGKKEEIEERIDSLDKNKSNDEKAEDFNHLNSSKNGYMLIYVRHEDAPMLFAPIPEESVPKHLIEYVKNNYSYGTKSSSSSSSSSSYTFYFTHENDMKLITVDEPSRSSLKTNNFQKSFKGSESMKLSQIYELAAKEFNSNIDEMRIWSCSSYGMPNKVLLNTDKETLKSDWYYYYSKNFFIQNKNKNEDVQIKSGNILLFLKFFFPGKEFPLQYLQSVITEKKSLDEIYQKCCQIIIQKLGLPNEIKLQAFIENYHGIPQELSSFSSQMYHSIDNGTILMFAPTPETAALLKTSQENFEFAKPPQEQQNNNNNNNNGDEIPVYRFSDYFDDLSLDTVIGYILSKDSVEFEVYDLMKQMKPLFKIITPNRIKASLVKEKIIDFAHLDFREHDDLLLFNLTVDYYNKQPTIQYIDTKFQSFENVFNKSLDLLKVNCNRLYFLHSKEADTAKWVSYPNITFSKDGRNSDLMILYPRKNETNLHDLVDLVKRILDGYDMGDGPFRFLKISQSKIVDFFNDLSINSKEMIKFDSSSKFRLEVVPPAQRPEELVANDAFLIKTFFAKESYSYYYYYSFEAYGQPFLFDVRKDELFSETLLRLRDFLKLPEDENFDDYKFMLNVDGSTYAKKYTEMLDGMKMYDKCNPETQFMILTDMESKKKEIKKQSSNEVKIYN